MTLVSSYIYLVHIQWLFHIKIITTKLTVLKITSIIYKAKRISLNFVSLFDLIKPHVDACLFITKPTDLQSRVSVSLLKVYEYNMQL